MKKNWCPLVGGISTYIEASERTFSVLELFLAPSLFLDFSKNKSPYLNFLGDRHQKDPREIWIYIQARYSRVVRLVITIPTTHTHTHPIKGETEREKKPKKDGQSIRGGVQGTFEG